MSFYEESTGKIVTFRPQEACLPPGSQPDVGSLACRLYVVELEDLRRSLLVAIRPRIWPL